MKCDHYVAQRRPSFCLVILGTPCNFVRWCDKLSSEFFIAKAKSLKFKGFFNHHFGTELALYRLEGLF